MKYVLPVKGSSTVTRVSYDTESETLKVVFTSGSKYEYYRVPLCIWEQFKAEIFSGGSAGAFLNFHIKGHFHFAQVD